MNHYLEKLQSNLSLGALFPKKPLIRFAPDLNYCPRCHRATQVWKTRTRRVATLCIGHFLAHETQGYCPHCADRPVFRAAQLHQLVPRGARYGYDVMEYVGQALFLRCRNGKEIRRELREKTSASPSEKLVILASDLLSIWHWYMSRARRNSSSSWTHGAAISCIWTGLAKAIVLIS